ncbi:aminotransferase class V-fold PLP-dependent enzyme [Myxococcota bacterium]
MLSDWRSVHDAYPINRRLVWLNNCGTTPAGLHVVEQMEQHFRAYAEQGPGASAFSPARMLGTIRSALADLIHCDREEIALVHNTAEGMNLISHGVQLDPGDQILVLEDEYPSNVYPWEHWKTRGVELRSVPLAVSPEAWLAKFRQSLTKRTKIAALSAVHWCTGMPLPLDAAAELCHDRGVLLVIDGSQGVGQVSIDMRELGPCVLVFSAWKWLLGPLGLGVLAVDRELFGSIDPVFKGPESVADSQAYLPYQTAFKRTAERYVCSTPNCNDWSYFNASLALLRAVGFGRVQARIHELSDHLYAGLTTMGFRGAYDRAASPGSGIVAVDMPGVDCGHLVRLLHEKGIVARERQGRLRLAPHIYLLPEQLDRSLDTIASHLEEARI